LGLTRQIISQDLCSLGDKNNTLNQLEWQPNVGLPDWAEERPQLGYF